MVMLNKTTLLQYIKMKLGLSEFVSPFTEEQICKIIDFETIYTFSKYYPYMFIVKIDESRDEWEKSAGIYYLRTEGLEVLGVARVFNTELSIQDKLPIYNTDMFDYQMYADLKSMVYLPYTFKFIPPNKIEMFPKYRNFINYSAEVKCVHPTHLMTIPLNLRDVFLKLAEYDVKIAMWQVLKNYESLPTAFASIDLKLGEFENAKDERETLLDKIKEKYYFEPNRRKIFIA